MTGELSHKSYEDGLRDGRINALRDTVSKHSDRLDSHSRRIGMLEKVSWIMLGIVSAIQAVPWLLDVARTAAKAV